MSAYEFFVSASRTANTMATGGTRSEKLVGIATKIPPEMDVKALMEACRKAMFPFEILSSQSGENFLTLFPLGKPTK